MILLSESKGPTAVEALSSSAAQQEPMAAELDEYASAYFLFNRLEDNHRELKEFSWILSPIIVFAGGIVGNLGSACFGGGDSPAMIVGGFALGALGAGGFNLSIWRKGKRALRARSRYEELEADLSPDTKEINP